MSYILGISCFYHDSAVALLKDGEIAFALQEERYSRIKQDKNFPQNALKACLSAEKISISDISCITYYEDPELKFERICQTYKNNFPKGSVSFAKNYKYFMEKKNIKEILHKELSELFPDENIPQIVFSQHHFSHAASAFYTSPYERAAILCIDGVGEWDTTTAWLGSGNQIESIFNIAFPHSLGLLYSAFTYYCGFKVDSGEYKLMGLAPYGNPCYVDLIYDNLLHLEEDGSFTLNRTFFDYEVGDCMISDKFEKLFSGPAREPESPITQKIMDIAASIQVITEEVVFGLARKVKSMTQADSLCLAGGVALNCVSNGKLLQSGLFKHIYVQPASGDAGGALGAALNYHYAIANNSRLTDGVTDRMNGGYLGIEYNDEQILSFLQDVNADYEYHDTATLLKKTSQCLADNKVVGWFQGRMEFGPRALGCRSILGNPQSPEMQRTMNLKIKNRESFRPFAPAILAEHVDTWFDITAPSPYMLMVAPVKSNQRLITRDDESIDGLDKLKITRSTIPAVTHVDYSARIQTVDGQYNPLFRSLIEAFDQITHCPILINTSFNVRGEPIVESPMDAYRCFMRTEMDYLVIGHYLLSKEKQPRWFEEVNWKEVYVLD
ncbi:carbamoyltransferase [Vibrio gazogenes]|uniref:Carbamoyltransferase n=1 Tax=Vibrio gazogenes DSM 21264 = NBRC 103151 TaxID=1123492 RepID=A0A1M4YTX1_VIBGA|nr:carbamoyltransferase [Vibrio gazogenes]USP15096.1 carbamoyltransferase [Vibrio gazogenes]SHF09183.1 carbamoyltransferase [Vibrio gazogenes DSM 21264] [Vibrio gazogenes DSM 21264 = NBRC 103151]